MLTELNNKYFVTYSDEKYEQNRQNLLNIAQNKFKCLPYSPKDIDENFYNKNYNILIQKRGIGYWLWKPYILLKTLNNINYGDYIFYLDSGDIFIEEIASYMDIFLPHNDVILVPGSHLQKKYTKRDCFVYMNCDEEKYWNFIQIEAGIILLKKTNFTIELISEWLHYCEDERILTDIENINKKQNFHDFIDHRHDQSILTNLANKYNIFLDNSIRRYVICNKV
jgi:hypothetical protein